jgi:predicted GIY-YIG superfamily endonuclease
MTVVDSRLYVHGRLRGAFVYMLLCQDDGDIYLKIGLSEQVLERYTQLRHGCPVTPQEFAYVTVPSRAKAKKLERALHTAMRTWKQHGEWFKVPTENKVAFKEAWKAVLKEHSASGWDLKWTCLNVKGLNRVLQQRRDYVRMMFKRSGPSFKDFIKAQ